MSKVTVRLPFEGYYQSYIMSEIDATLEMEAENQDENEEALKAIEDFALNAEGFETIAKDYVDFVSELMDVPLEFERLISPRFYNFETDKIYAKVDPKHLMPLDEPLKQWLVETADNEYTSRDGFISFVDPNIAKVFDKPYVEWDEPYLDLVFRYMVEQEVDTALSLEVELSDEYLTGTHNGSEFVRNTVIDALYS